MLLKNKCTKDLLFAAVYYVPEAIVKGYWKCFFNCHESAIQARLFGNEALILRNMQRITNQNAFATEPFIQHWKCLDIWDFVVGINEIKKLLRYLQIFLLRIYFIFEFSNTDGNFGSSVEEKILNLAKQIPIVIGLICFMHSMI